MATSSAPAPLPTPSDDAYVAALDDSLEFGSETLAEGQSGRSETNLSDSDLQVLNWVETDDPVFFITIDDGLVEYAGEGERCVEQVGCHGIERCIAAAETNRAESVRD